MLVRFDIKYEIDELCNRLIRLHIEYEVKTICKINTQIIANESANRLTSFDIKHEDENPRE